MGNLCCPNYDPKNYVVEKSKPYSELIKNYEFKENRKLGNGAFGIVYIATCRASKIQYAIKVMDIKEMEEDDIEQLKREIGLLKKHKHTNICEVYDCYESTSKIYMRMELCKGGELGKMIRKKGSIDE